MARTKYLWYSLRSDHNSEQGEYLATYGPPCDLMNARTKYHWYSLSSDHNTPLLLCFFRLLPHYFYLGEMGARGKEQFSK